MNYIYIVLGAGVLIFVSAITMFIVSTMKSKKAKSLSGQQFPQQQMGSPIMQFQGGMFPNQQIPQYQQNPIPQYQQPYQYYQPTQVNPTIAVPQPTRIEIEDEKGQNMSANVKIEILSPTNIDKDSKLIVKKAFEDVVVENFKIIKRTLKMKNIDVDINYHIKGD